jgi:hypothetical protein
MTGFWYGCLMGTLLGFGIGINVTVLLYNALVPR